MPTINRVAFLIMLFCGLFQVAFAQYISKPEATADLDQLEEYLIRYASYLHLNDINYSRHLDSLRNNLEEEQRIDALAKDIQRFIGLLGDTHAKVFHPNEISTNEQNKDGYLPFVITQQADRAVAVHPTCQQLWVDEFPYILQINDIPFTTLLKEAGVEVAGVCAARYHHVAINKLANIRPILKALGADHGDHLHIILENRTGDQDTSIYTYMLPDRKYPYIKQLAHPKGLINATQNIAYLPISSMYDKHADDELVAYLATVQAMHLETIKNSDGLIIDVRGNTGGERHILFELYPFFITEPKVVSVAISKFNKLNGLYKRGLYPIDYEDWTLDERTTIEKFKRNFKPAWNFNRTEFLDQYFYMVISPYDGAYQYEGPIVLLMDESCFGSTAVFLSAFAQLDNVTLVGMPNAGGHGRSGRFTLHHSKILIQLSTMATFRANGALFDGTGIHPDIWATPTLEDIIGKTDSVLDKAIQILIEQKKQYPYNKKEKDTGFYEIFMRNNLDADDDSDD